MNRHFRPAWLLPLLVLFAACASNPPVPNVPKVATVTVHVHDPAPAWATEPLQKPALKNTTGFGHLSHEAALDAFADVLLCERKLLAQLGDGKQVDPKACQNPDR